MIKDNNLIPIIGITVSTKYDDILELIIKQNANFLTKWYIITDENDVKTIELIQNTKLGNIEILYFNFWGHKIKFNKGGAIEYAQQKIYHKYENEDICVLILDSDIYLPNYFMESYKETQKELYEDVIYAPFHRYDFGKYSDFVNEKNGIIYYLDQKHMGFFQLYYIKKKSILKDKLFYKKSVNCASCDSLFRNLFTKRELINNLIVSHLGTPKVNWNTRKSHDDFIIDITPNL